MSFATRFVGFSWVLLGVLAAGPAGAARNDKTEGEPERVESESTDRTDEGLSAGSCPLLFGDEATHAAYAAHRSLALRWVAEREHTVTLVHSTDWQPPTPLQYEGLELIEARPGVAWLELPTEAAEELDCPAGQYRIEVDDAIGSSGQVLAILDDLVLVNEEGTLGAWLPEGVREPRWELAWTSTWGLSKPAGKSTAPVRRTPVPKPRK